MKEFEIALPSIFSMRKVEIKKSALVTESKHFENFAEILFPVKKNLYNFIFKSLNFSEDASDVYQDTVLRALKYFKRFDITLPFKPWLFSIANNEIKKYFKKRNLFSNENSINELCNTISDEKEKELIKTIYYVAENLKPQDRQVFFLFYDNGFSVVEISEIMGIKTGNIKVILSNSRKKIRNLLEV